MAGKGWMLSLYIQSQTGLRTVLVCVCVCECVYTESSAYSGVIATLQLHTLFCEGVDGGGEQRLISPLLLLDGSDIKTPCSRPIDLRASLSAAGKKPASQPATSPKKATRELPPLQ
jgi:hypothetical protein